MHDVRLLNQENYEHRCSGIRLRRSSCKVSSLSGLDDSALFSRIASSEVTTRKVIITIKKHEWNCWKQTPQMQPESAEGQLHHQQRKIVSFLTLALMRFHVEHANYLAVEIPLETLEARRK